MNALGEIGHTLRAIARRPSHRVAIVFTLALVFDRTISLVFFAFPKQEDEERLLAEYAAADAAAAARREDIP